jgi:hypothetical protein
VTAFQLDPSTHAPCTSNTLAFERPPPEPAGAACATELRPGAATTAAPATAAVPFKTVRRVGIPIVSPLTRSVSMRASESRLAAPVAPVTTLVSSLADDPDRPFHPRDPRQNNDFTYAADQDGRQVPLGSHMRRMNPRDTKMTVLADVNIHRIVRRSTVFGAP